MKFIKFIFISVLLINSGQAFSQNTASGNAENKYPLRTLTTEPAVGITAAQITGVVVSNLLQWNIKKGLSVISYTGFTQNCAFQRDFNQIRTDYNYSLSQKFGIGTTYSVNHFSHTISFAGGVKYDAYKETLHNPEFEEVSVKHSSVSPDFGLLYNMKVGKNKYFFSFRMYLPLYPYPFETDDVSATDANMANATLEFGIGIRLK